MSGVDTGWFRTESGVIIEMDLPLPDGIAQRVSRGEIVRVADAEGAPWPDEHPAPVEPEPTADQLEVQRLRALLVEAGIDPDNPHAAPPAPPAPAADESPAPPRQGRAARGKATDQSAS
jgi:hypothetical protein